MALLSACTVTGPSGSCTLTGLTNGDAYTFVSSARNVGGSSTTSPASTDVIPEGSPSSTTAPTTSGIPTIGATLTASTGAWQGGGLTYSYQWLRDGTPIPGETAPTYALTTGDAGHQISVRVTATNRVSQASATSVSVTVAAPGTQPAPPPGAPGCPARPDTCPAPRSDRSRWA